MNSNGKEIERLLDIMDQLLSPQGCPWDENKAMNPGQVFDRREL